MAKPNNIGYLRNISTKYKYINSTINIVICSSKMF